MESTSSSGAVRLGPLARRLLARRRRWLRWAAFALAALTILSAVAQFRHRPAPRRSPVPAHGGAVHSPAPASRFYGVAAEVPPGMRAINLIVPAASTFGGRLAPLSRVDVLAAFDVGQDRAVQRVLASGIVLHITPQSAASASGTASPLPSAEGRLGPPPVAELSIAVPAAREREVVMAQAFGRVFVAVAPGAAVVPVRGAGARGLDCAAMPAPASAGSLSLRRYLDLPPAPGPSRASTGPAFLPPPLGLLPAPGFPWPGGAVVRPSSAPGSAHDAARPPDARHGLAVEVIEGTARTVAEVTP